MALVGYGVSIATAGFRFDEAGRLTWEFAGPFGYHWTNAFRGYRAEVLRRCGPFRACHFSITLEMSLAAWICGYPIREIPIAWEGPTLGSINLRLKDMGHRYLCTLLMLFFQRILVSDDVRSERVRQASLGQEIQKSN